MGGGDRSGAEPASEATGGAATADAEIERPEALAEPGADGLETVWSAVVSQRQGRSGVPTFRRLLNSGQRQRHEIVVVVLVAHRGQSAAREELVADLVGSSG